MTKLFSDTNDGEGDGFDIADGDINAVRRLDERLRPVERVRRGKRGVDGKPKVQYPQFTEDYMDNYDGDDGDEYTNNRTAYRIVIVYVKLFILNI
jgi:hypothetical protein